MNAKEARELTENAVNEKAFDFALSIIYRKIEERAKMSEFQIKYLHAKRTALYHKLCRTLQSKGYTITEKKDHTVISWEPPPPSTNITNGTGQQ